MREYNSIKREKIFDGIESEFLKKVFKQNIDGKIISFSARDFYNNPLRDLKNEISNNEFDMLISTEKFSKEKNFFENYKSQENLNVYYMVKEGKIFIISFGEFQPARFLIFIESIWVK